MKILFAGGGTGGHTFPIIAVVREIKRLVAKDEVSFAYIGPADDMTQIFLGKEGIDVKTIMAGKLRRYFGLKPLFQNIVDIFLRLPVGLFQAFFFILFSDVGLIFSAGGYGSLPVILAGFMLGKPVFLHELDIAPGLANRIGARFASGIFVSFPTNEMRYPVNKMVHVGNPIRNDLLDGSRDEAKKIFNLSGGKPIIFIFGGSQGSRRINELIIKILPEILDKFELLHQTGPRNFEEVKNAADSKLTKERGYEGLKKYYHPVPFLEEDLKHAYAVCDLIISRAGSSSIFEIAALGKPSILIPLLESAQNHQVRNAYGYAKTGAAIVIEETNLSQPLFFLEKLKNLMSQSKELEGMSLAAKNFSSPDAAKKIAKYVLSMEWVNKL